MLLQDLLGQFDPSIDLTNLPASPVAAVRDQTVGRADDLLARGATARLGQLGRAVGHDVQEVNHSSYLGATGG